MVKTPFTFLQIQLKVLFGNTVKLTQMAFCLVPKVLNSVNVILPLSKMCVVIDTEVAKFTHIKYIIAFVAVGINNAVRLHLLANNRQ